MSTSTMEKSMPGNLDNTGAATEKTKPRWLPSRAAMGILAGVVVVAVIVCIVVMAIYTTSQPDEFGNRSGMKPRRPVMLLDPKKLIIKKEGMRTKTGIHNKDAIITMGENQMRRSDETMREMMSDKGLPYQRNKIQEDDYDYRPEWLDRMSEKWPHKYDFTTRVDTSHQSRYPREICRSFTKDVYSPPSECI